MNDNQILLGIRDGFAIGFVLIPFLIWISFLLS